MTMFVCDECAGLRLTKGGRKASWTRSVDQCQFCLETKECMDVSSKADWAWPGRYSGGCVECGSRLEPMEGAASMADFECPKCHPESFETPKPKTMKVRGCLFRSNQPTTTPMSAQALREMARSHGWEVVELEHGEVEVWVETEVAADALQ
jgi:hypothetical protein